MLSCFRLHDETEPGDHKEASELTTMFTVRCGPSTLNYFTADEALEYFKGETLPKLWKRKATPSASHALRGQPLGAGPSSG